VRGLRSLGNRDLTYKLAFFGTYLEEDNEWKGRGAKEKAVNIRSEEKLELQKELKELGDPATGKSEMLRWVSKFLPCLTASVVKEADLDNERLIQPGALMLAARGPEGCE
ncbi:hypothetical protein AK812_SmicGene45009, partial [Symbiodinium microadriaticum]